MNEEDVRAAVDYLIEVARKHGKISPKVFEQTCIDFFVDPKVLSARFFTKTANSWSDYKITAPKRQDDNLALALSLAKRSFEEGNNWWESFKKNSGSVFKSKNRQYVYVGSAVDADGNLVHHIIRVMDLKTIRTDWTGAHADYPQLVALLI